MLSVALMVSARESSYEHTDVFKLRAGGGYQLDTYLSSLGYTGWQVGLGNEWWQPFRQDSRLGKTGKLDRWGHVGRMDITGIGYTNDASSNNYYGIQLSGGWGAFYCLQWYDNRLKLHLGPYLDAGFTVRNQTVNVNKPVSFDVAIDVMGMAGISWSFYGRKTSYRIHYMLRTNLIGFDYLPEYWQSYYEVAEGVSGLARCSGHWNHNTLKHEMSIDIQFPHSTWRLGAEHELIRYYTDNQYFMRNQLCLVVGCIWQYKTQTNARL